MASSQVSEKKVVAGSSIANDGKSNSIENPINIDLVETDDILKLIQNKVGDKIIRSLPRKRTRYEIVKSQEESEIACAQPSEILIQCPTIEIDDLITAFSRVEQAEINYKIKKMKQEVPNTNENSNSTSVSRNVSTDEIEVDLIIRIPSSVSSKQSKESDEMKLEQSKVLKHAPEFVPSSDFLCNLEKLFAALKCNNSLEARCQGIFDLAFLYLSDDSSKVQPSECFRAIQLLSDSYKNKSLAFCHAILLCTLTKQSMTWYEMQFLEDSILSLVHFVPKDGENAFSDFKLFDLPVSCQVDAQKLCQKILLENALNFAHVNTSAILCTSLFNLSTYVKQFCCNIEEDYIYKEKTLKYIFARTGNATQKIASNKIFDVEQKYHDISITSYIIKHCLYILEHALFINPAKHSPYLQHEAFSLPHCLTRLLGWSISSVFSEEQHLMNSEQKSCEEFHLSTLISLLKIFSVLTFNPNQYDSFTNVKGLMEKIMICILKAYFESVERHFDVLVLCLEMMINLFIKNQKTFILLCLKKFKINNCEEIPTIEALIKMLSEILEKIKEIKSTNPSNECTKEVPEKSNSSQSDSNELELQRVLQAAGKDMELSTIAAFICILIAFFMKTRENFMDFVRERLPIEITHEAVDVSARFLEFATLTGGMPETGLMLLKYAITKLKKMH